MLRYRRRALIALSILVLGAAVTGGVVAASQSSDEQALQPARHAASPAVDSCNANPAAAASVAWSG